MLREIDMSEFPFELEFDSIFPRSGRVSVRCLSRIRSVPKKRDVYDGVYEGKCVIVKVFRDAFKSSIHCRKEWKGLQELGRRGIRSPEALMLGRCDDGSRLVVIEKITDSEVVFDYFGSLDEVDEKVKILKMVCVELADQHKQGVFQQDLHLGNFLLKDDKLFTIDPSEIRFISGELQMRRSLKQLAGILCNVSDEDGDAIRILCEEYFLRRGYGRCDRFIKRIMKYRASIKEKVIKSSLKKSLRTSKRTLKIRNRKVRAVFMRDFPGDSDPYELACSLDGMMDAGEVLKRGNTCYVSRVHWGGKDVVIKRYNNKGIFHSIRHTIKGSRARKNWLYSQYLQMIDVANPAVLAYVEFCYLGIIRTSYVINQFVDGSSIQEYLTNSELSHKDKNAIIKRTEKLLSRLIQYRLTHGDMKPSNILICDDQPVLIDLDSMQLHRFSFALKFCSKRMLRKFRFRINQI